MMWHPRIPDLIPWIVYCRDPLNEKRLRHICHEEHLHEWLWITEKVRKKIRTKLEQSGKRSVTEALMRDMSQEFVRIEKS